MKPRLSVFSHDTPSTIALGSGALTWKRYLVAPTVAPRIAGASPEGEPSPYEQVLTKKRLPNERTLRSITPALWPSETATETLWCSKEQSLMQMPSLRRDEPEGAITTPTTKWKKLHCSRVTPFEGRP